MYIYGNRQLKICHSWPLSDSQNNGIIILNVMLFLLLPFCVFIPSLFSSIGIPSCVSPVPFPINCPIVVLIHVFILSPSECTETHDGLSDQSSSQVGVKTRQPEVEFDKKQINMYAVSCSDSQDPAEYLDVSVVRPCSKVTVITVTFKQWKRLKWLIVFVHFLFNCKLGVWWK